MIKPGKLREPSWSWESNDNDIRVLRASLDGHTSIAEFLACMQEAAPGIALQDITVNFGLVTWKRPATEAEIAKRREVEARQAEKREKWERETLARLQAKYGVSP